MGPSLAVAPQKKNIDDRERFPSPHPTQRPSANVTSGNPAMFLLSPTPKEHIIIYSRNHYFHHVKALSQDGKSIVIRKSHS